VCTQQLFRERQGEKWAKLILGRQLWMGGRVCPDLRMEPQQLEYLRHPRARNPILPGKVSSFHTTRRQALIPPFSEG
jgi:hypothetical protein